MKSFGARPRATLLPLFGILFCCGMAHATVYTGNSSTGRLSDGSCGTVGNDNGDFNDPRNWGAPCQPGHIPGSLSTADLGAHGVHATSVNVATIIITGGSLTADSIAAKTLTLNNGGISGNNSASSTVSVLSAFNWTGGSIGNTTMTLGAKCVSKISGDADSSTTAGHKYLNYGAIIINQGAITWSGAGIGSGGLLRNEGTFKMASDGLVSSDTNGLGISFVNSGLFTKSSGSGETRIGLGSGFVNNGGTLQAKSGIFDPSVGYYSNTTLTSGSTIAAGSGIVRQNYPWSFTGTINVAGTFRITTNDNTGKATFTGAGKIDWRSGGFSATPDTTAITFAPSMHSVMTGTGVKVLYNLTNQGLLTWNGGTIGGGTLKNTGTFNLLNDGDLSGLSLINTGTFAKTGGAGVVKTGNHLLDNSGIIDIQEGALQLDANPNAGSDIFRGGTLIKGVGKVVEYTPVTCSGTITIDTTLQLDDANGGSAATVGPNTFTGKGQINWYGGTMQSASIASGFTVNAQGTPAKGFSQTTNNAGTINWRGGSTVNLGPNNSDSLINTGTYNVLASGFFAQGTLVNKGTLNTFEGNSLFFPHLFNYNVLNLGTATKPGILQIAGSDGESFHNYGTVNGFVVNDQPGHYSQIQGNTNGNVVTSLVLAGTFALTVDPKFTPTAGSQFTLVKIIPDRASYTGKFASIRGLPVIGGRAFQPFYNPLDVTLGLPLNITGRTYRTVGSTLQGISGTSITLQPASGTAQTTTSDGNGNFSFNGLQSSSYTVSVSNPNVNFDVASKKVTLPTSGMASSPDSVVTFQTFSASAKVVDQSGAPVAGVTVGIQGPGISAYVLTTNASGIALFPDLGTGTYTLTPQAQTGFSFSPTSLSVRLPTTGTTGLSPNGAVLFTRKPTASTSQTASFNGQ